MSFAGGLIFVIGVVLSYIAHLSIKKTGEVLDLKANNLEKARTGDQVKVEGEVIENYNERAQIWVIKEFIMNRTTGSLGGMALSILGKSVGTWETRAGGIQNAELILDVDGDPIKVDFGERWCDGEVIGKVVKGTIIESLGFFDSDFRKIETLNVEEKLPEPLIGKFETPSKPKAEDYEYESAMHWNFGQRKIFKGEVKEGDTMEVIGQLRIKKDSKVVIPDPEKISVIATPNRKAALKWEYLKGKTIFYCGIILALLGLNLVV